MSNAFQSLLRQNERYQVLVDTLLAELSHYEASSLQRQPAPGKWSALQTAHHLLLTEEMGLRYVLKKLSFGAEKVPPIGLGTWWRSSLLVIYLYLPLRFKAPVVVGPESEPEPISLDALTSRWKEVRTKWTNFFKSMPPEQAGLAIYRHPRAGRIGFKHALAFYFHHLLRHRKQIRRAVSAK